jgi:hypothetical protein
MKLHVLYAVLALATFLLGCAGKVPLPKQIPDALNEACKVYSKAKPQVVAARDYAKAHWNEKIPGSDKDLIPADVKTLLQELDSYLPELDKAGLALCGASEALNAITAAAQPGGAAGAAQKVDWNQVLTVVLKGASLALDLKAKGAI